MRRFALALLALLLVGVCIAKAPRRGGPPPAPAPDLSGERIGPGGPVPPAGTARVTVHADEIEGAIPDVLYGSQLLWWPEMNGLPDLILTNADYRRAMEKWWSYLPVVREIGPTVVRYPGGLEAMEFTWTDTIGPFEERPRTEWPRWRPGGKVAIGPDEFARWAEALGAEMMITLNVNDVPVPGKWHSGSQQEATAWVAYMNGSEVDATPIGPDGNGRDWGTAGDWAARRRAHCEWINAHSGLPKRDCARPYGVRYWEMGNECSYHTVWLMTSQSPARYGEIVARYADAMRAVDPEVRVGAVGNDNPLFGHGPWKGWFAGVDNAIRQAVRLKHARGGADFWVKHEYPPAVSPVAHGIVLKKPGARLSWRRRVPEAGRYRLAFDLYGQGGALDAGPGWALEVDGVKVAEGVSGNGASERTARVETAPFDLAAGERAFALVAAPNVAPDRRLEFAFGAELLREGAKEAARVNLRSAREAQALMLAAAAAKAEFLPEPKEALGGRPVFVTEFHQDWLFKTQRRENEPVYLQDALGLAGMYALFLESGVVEAALLWTLFDDRNEFGEIEGVGVEGKAEDAASRPKGAPYERGRKDPRLRPAGLVHKLFAETLRGERLRVESDVPRFTVLPAEGVELGFGGLRPASLPWLHVLAARRPDGRLALLVANRDPWRDIEAEIRVAGASPSGEVRARALRGDGLLASNEPEDCPGGGCVRIEPASASAAEGVLRGAFPAASVTAVLLEVRPDAAKPE